MEDDFLHRALHGTQRKFQCTSVWLMLPLLALLFCPQAQSALLNLKQAERIALEQNPLLKSYQAMVIARDKDALAKNQLPDPKLRFGLYNLPLDSFSTTEHPTTQFRLGMQQAFPRGDSLDLKQRQGEWEAAAEKARADDERRKLLRDVRETYLNLFYHVEAAVIVEATRSLFTQLVDITEAHYASGRVNQQDVLRAELELSRLEDRGHKIRTEEDEHRAKLSRWIGDVASLSIEGTFPALPELIDDDVMPRVERHPAVQVETAIIEAARQGIEISRQQYKPGWGLGLEYRKRFGDNPDGSEREDMMAAMVSVDMPLFNRAGQDNRVAASEAKANAAVFKREDKLRQLLQSYESNRARLVRLDQRHHHYKTDLILSTRNNSEAALKAYQSGVTEFTNLMRAHITELDVRLADLRIRVDLALAKTRMIYVAGEEL